MGLRGWLGILFLVASAAASWLLFKNIQQAGPDRPAGSAGAEGYYLKDAAILGTSEDGTLLYTVEAADVRHLPQERRVAMQTVKVRYSDTSQPAWSASSGSGSIEDDGARISLTGNVRLTNEDPAQKNNYVIETDALEFRPRERFASTDGPVRITQPGVVLTAVGLEADLENEIVNLKAEVSGQFRP